MEYPPDILRAARHMIDRHGNYAAIAASDRAKNLARSQQDSAAELWRQIAAAVEEISGPAKP